MNLKARVRYVDAGTKVLSVDLLGLTGRELKVIVDSLRMAANVLHMRSIDLYVDRGDAASCPRDAAIKLHEEEVRAASREASVLGDNIARVFQEAM